MRILLEEHKYAVTDELKKILCGIGLDTMQDIEGNVSLSYVGYFYNPEINDYVFILPKVLMDDHDKVFGEHTPEELLEKDLINLTQTEQRFIYEFAVWIYRAIAVYHNAKPDSDIIYHKQISQIGHTKRRRTNTMLDVILSLIKFAKDHQDFITFTLKNIHSGHNKINWTRTISRSQAIIQDGAPIYLNPVNKKRQINFDEELLIIFYSILNYIKEKYGFQVNINLGFALIKGAKFESYINGRGKIRLRQIKYKYFSDIALEMWEYCYAFFDRSQSITATTKLEEFLLVKNFYIVFEAIIDELLGSNKEKKELDKKLVEQRDGKIVDHLYTYDGLVQSNGQTEQTYYIGDSKYYKIGHDLGETSIYKQYTYARNIIQYNVSLWMDDSMPNPDVKVRDDQTEGYNILPNFFISADMKKGDFSYSHRDIVLLESTRCQPNPSISYQFEDRLFDRDTLLLSRYNVNFLFVIALYARNKQSEKLAWQKEVRQRFRKELQKVLETKFLFYPMRSKGVVSEDYVQTHFKQLIGKVFTPFDDKEILTLALQKPDTIEDATKRAAMETEHTQLLAMLEKDFTIQDNYSLGQQPQLPPRAAIQCSSVDTILIGYYKNDQHKKWILEKRLYNARLGDAKGSVDVTPQLLSAKYILLHGKEGISLCQLDGKGPRIITKTDLISNHEYPSQNPNAEYYLLFNIKGKGIRKQILEEHGFDMNALWKKLGIDTAIKQQNNLTLRPNTITFPELLDCLKTPITKEEIE